MQGLADRFCKQYEFYKLLHLYICVHLSGTLQQLAHTLRKFLFWFSIYYWKIHLLKSIFANIAFVCLLFPCITLKQLKSFTTFVIIICLMMAILDCGAQGHGRESHIRQGFVCNVVVFVVFELLFIIKPLFVIICFHSFCNVCYFIKWTLHTVQVYNQLLWHMYLML